MYALKFDANHIFSQDLLWSNMRFDTHKTVFLQIDDIVPTR